MNGKRITNGIPDVLSCIGLDVGKKIVFDIKGESGKELKVSLITAADKHRKTGSKRR